MRPNHILILGAGVYQVPLIRRAVESGYRVTVASYGDYPGMKIAHNVWHVDTTDRETLLDLARKHKIDAVTTTGTDVAMPAIGYLNDSLELPGVGFETARLTSDKILMQRRFRGRGVPSARFSECMTLGDAKSAAEEIGLPVIIKAPNSSGSRGITVVTSGDHLEEAFRFAKEVASNSAVLAEELLIGEEFGAQAVIIDGEMSAFLCHNDTVTAPPVTVPVGHSCPSRLPLDVQDEARDVCARAARALEITDAVCNCDLIHTKGGVKILEIGARVGATGIPEIVLLHYGIDLYHLALSFALGERPVISSLKGLASAIRIVEAPRTGRLVSCHVSEELMGREGVIAVDLDYPVGSPVRKFRVGPDRIGSVVVTAEDADAAERFADSIIQELHIEVQ